jgi:hypothetical protein
VKADDATRRSVAADAGRKKRSRAEPTQCLNDSVQALLAAFRQTISDRAPEARSKKKGTINVAVNLFKVYFRLDKASKCTEVWKVIDKLPRFPTLESFPLSHSVPYSYYAGRLHMLEGDDALAERELSFAFHRCHRGSRANVRRILCHLIPVRMLRGSFPTSALLREHGLEQFAGVARAVRTGDLRLFRQSMDAHGAAFIAQGTFLVLERLRLLALRNCLKRIWAVQGRGARLDIRDAAQVFAWLGVLDDVSQPPEEEGGQAFDAEEGRLDEAECILANLIHAGFLRGYIAHGHRKLVLSKKDAFPKFKDVLRKLAASGRKSWH